LPPGDTSDKSSSYNLDFLKSFRNTTLPDVIVTYKGKTKLQQFEEQYTSSFFKSAMARKFDGLENDDIANSVDIAGFLQSRLPGLRVDPEDRTLTWRNLPVTVYIDEFRLARDQEIFVNPAEVAMIIADPPPSFIGGHSGSGGVVAIYTRKGRFENDTVRKYRFTFKGYTPPESVWK
jgi:hypothetical protein